MPDLKALSRQWFDQVWNKGDAATIDKLMSPHCLAEGLSPDGQPVKGPAGFKPFWANLRATFPDLHIDVTDVIAEGDKTAVRIVLTGTHQGPGLGIPPTGRKVRVTGLCLVHWKDGQVIGGANEYDVAGMMRQLTA